MIEDDVMELPKTKERPGKYKCKVCKSLVFVKQSEIKNGWYVCPAFGCETPT